MNYCTNLKKKKNKPFCKLINKEITFSLCRECDNKEYKKSTSDKKSSVASGLLNNSQMRKHSQTLTKKQQKPAKMHNKSKKLTKLERNRKSVFTDNLDICYLCGRKKNDLHEVYAGRNRINSINMDLYYLCAENATLLTKITHSLTIIGTSKVNCTGKSLLALEKNLLRYLEEIISNVLDNHYNLLILNQILLACFFALFVLQNIH